jgi:hypothetical protein
MELDQEEIEILKIVAEGSKFNNFLEKEFYK